MIRKTALALSLLVCGIAHADEPTLYDTLDSAASAALQQSVTLSSSTRHYEFGGVIYHVGDKFAFTAPGTSKDGSHFAVTVGVPGGWANVAAIYHDHPGNVASDKLFSGDDIKIADQRKVPSYIGVTYDSKIRVYTPGKSTKDRQGFDYTSTGTVVGTL